MEALVGGSDGSQTANNFYEMVVRIRFGTVS